MELTDPKRTASSSDLHRSLHPSSIAGASNLGAFFENASNRRAKVYCGLDDQIHRREAVLEKAGDSLRLGRANFEMPPGSQIRVTLNLDGVVYWFESHVEGSPGRAQLDLRLPDAIYQKDLRARERVPVSSVSGYRTVSIEHASHTISDAPMADFSDEGVAALLRQDTAELLNSTSSDLKVRDGRGEHYGVLRHMEPVGDGWVRAGIQLYPNKPRNVPENSLDGSKHALGRSAAKAQSAIRVARSTVDVLVDRTLRKIGISSKPIEPTILDFSDRAGLPIRGILDTWGDSNGATAVVVPPAWGRTKETLLPLAHTIVSCFREIGEPVVVLRFDGVGKRGESYKEESSRRPGKECSSLTFSQGVEDILGAVDVLQETIVGPNGRFVVVSFSASSIEARRAVATDQRIGGWVSVVGSADLQSMMKRISGGVDYALGIERGLSFGPQEILGVEVDIDHAGSDALANDLVYMSDARRDMCQISSPITWIYGEADAWMDVERVRDMLGQGDPGNRRLVRSRMGHMMRSSTEALGVFTFVANEISRMVGSGKSASGLIDARKLERQRLGERARRGAVSRFDPSSFWSTYLLGESELSGYRLLAATSSFREFMDHQVTALEVSSGTRVLDLGSGTGAFVRELVSRGKLDQQVIELDLVLKALRAAREAETGAETKSVQFVQADAARSKVLPFRNESFDCALGSLILSYVDEPLEILRDLRRVIRPNGRLVVSTMVADADMSKLFTDGANELMSRTGELQAARLQESIRSFQNQASLLLDMEEAGVFQFWEPEEFAELVENAGFRVLSHKMGFGTPPQAVTVTAVNAA